VLTRNLEDMACANADELRAALPGFDGAGVTGARSVKWVVARDAW
jgi:hypothetical protein